MKILVVGGAGYIGSHMVKRLQETKYQVEILDNLSTGHELNTQNYKLYKYDLCNKEEVYQILKENQYDCVMHFASSIDVQESFLYPKKYYENNVINTKNLLDCMVEAKIFKIIFSSSAAVYGEPKAKLLTEEHSINPINPYGETKAKVENMLKNYDKNHNLKFISLRYFNACGAHIDGTIGEKHKPETHLIPLVLQTASGRKKKISIYVNDYSTPDGTCVRDYIHVMDLVEAHLLALKNLIKKNQSNTFNLGTKVGFSIKEIIEKAREITQSNIPYDIEPRRKGDPPYLIADNQKILDQLDWRPRYSSLDNIIQTAWDWEKKLFKMND